MQYTVDAVPRERLNVHARSHVAFSKLTFEALKVEELLCARRVRLCT